MKIAHYLASTGLCSRREGERIVQTGSITINDIVVDNVAQRVEDNDVVKHEGKVLSLITEPKIYGYYKPVLTLVTHAYDPEKVNVFELLEPRIGKMLSVGRLDYMSEGLLLLTDSNKLCSELMHGGMIRKYTVLLSEIPVNLHVVTKHFVMEGIRYLPWTIDEVNGDWVTITLTEGKNREIRRVFAFLGSTVHRLIRIQYGPYHLQGSPDQVWKIA